MVNMVYQIFIAAKQFESRMSFGLIFQGLQLVFLFYIWNHEKMNFSILQCKYI